jgi:hypothetical protein
MSIFRFQNDLFLFAVVVGAVHVVGAMTNLGPLLKTVILK